MFRQLKGKLSLFAKQKHSGGVTVFGSALISCWQYGLVMWVYISSMQHWVLCQHFEAVIKGGPLF